MSTAVRAWAWGYGVLWLATLVGASAGFAFSRATVAARRDHGGGALFVEVLATNLRLLGVLVIAALLVQLVPAWRWPLDATVAGLLAFNAVAVGAAIGAGGIAVARSLVHLPLEWAALAGGAGLYVLARRSDLRLVAAVRWSGAALSFGVASAAVEAWLPLG